MVKDTLENKVWVTVSYTVNLGNYESLKVEAGESGSFEEGTDDPAAIRKQLETTLIREVTKIADNFKNKRNGTT